MGFFGKFFGKDTIEMVDVEEKEEEKPFVNKEDRQKTCVPKTDKKDGANSSPFLDDCDE